MRKLGQFLFREAMEVSEQTIGCAVKVGDLHE